MVRLLRPGIACAILVALTATPALSVEAIEEMFANQVRWSDDGAIEATCYAAEGIAGVHCNEWIDLGKQPRIGQTFRCEGPTLAGVQLGLGALSGAPGLRSRGRPPAITVSLYRGGPGGELVARKRFAADEVTNDVPLLVDEPSDPETLWYYELVAEGEIGANRDHVVNAVAEDPYPDGEMYLGGKPFGADLHLRVHREWPVSGELEGDVVLWSAAPEERLWPEAEATVDLMFREGATGPLQLTSARNEWVSAQVTATPAPWFEAETVDLEVAPWRGPDGPTPEARIEWLRYSLEYYKGRTRERLYPDPLAATARAQLSPDLDIEQPNTTFWLSVRVPEGAAAGTWRSTIRATVNGTRTLEMPVELEVWDFALPEETHTRTGLFRATGGSHERHLWWTEDLADFRIAMGYPFAVEEHALLRKSDFSEGAYRKILGPQFQSMLVAVGETVNRRGLHLTMVCPWADTYRVIRGEPEAGYEGMRRFWEVYYPILQERGWVDEAYARMPDELGPDRIDEAREIAAKTREWAPGVEIMVTSMGTPNVEDLARAVGIADIWCPSSRYLPRAMDFYQERRDAGEQVWPYIHDFLFHVSDTAGGRLFFWMLEKHGLEGVSYWSLGPRGEFEHAPHGVIRRDDVRQGDGTLYYPGTEGTSVRGLWRSTRLHRIRDGIEDREYFRVLDTVCATAEADGRMTPELAARVEAVRRGPEELTFGFSNHVHDADMIEQHRRAIAEVILELQ